MKIFSVSFFILLHFLFSLFKKTFIYKLLKLSIKKINRKNSLIKKEVLKPFPLNIFLHYNSSRLFVYPSIDLYKVKSERLLHKKSDWNYYYLHIKFTRLYPHKSSLLLLMYVLRMSNHCQIIIPIIIYNLFLKANVKLLPE